MPPEEEGADGDGTDAAGGAAAAPDAAAGAEGKAAPAATETASDEDREAKKERNDDDGDPKGSGDVTPLTEDADAGPTKKKKKDASMMTKETQAKGKQSIAIFFAMGTVSRTRVLQARRRARLYHGRLSCVFCFSRAV